MSPTFFGASSKRAERRDSIGKWGFADGLTKVSVTVKTRSRKRGYDLSYQAFRKKGCKVSRQEKLWRRVREFGLGLSELTSCGLDFVNPLDLKPSAFVMVRHCLFVRRVEGSVDSVLFLVIEFVVLGHAKLVFRCSLGELY